VCPSLHKTVGKKVLSCSEDCGTLPQPVLWGSWPVLSLLSFMASSKPNWMILLGKHLTRRRLLTCQVRQVEIPVEVACLCQPAIRSGGGRSTVLHQLKEVRDTKQSNLLQTPGCATTYSAKRTREGVRYHSVVIKQFHSSK